jgi:uncharacterized damage-inducible protein DinB
MTRDYLMTLLDFHYWARDRVLDAAAVLTPEAYAAPRGSSFASVRETLEHLYLAEWLWLKRLHGEVVTKRPEIDLSDVAALRAAWRELEAQWRSWLDGTTEPAMQTVIEYRLLNGQPRASAIWQIVAHMVNHGSYHRGQVTTLLRQIGAEPPLGTDLIAYFREVSAGDSQAAGRT